MNLLKQLFGAGTPGVDAPAANELLQGQQPPFLLDVRQPDEFAGGHIAGAKLIPLGELARRMNELPRDRTILCVCRSGSRSSAAARQLTSAGYQVLNLQIGMIGWTHNGLPTKRGK